MERKIDIFEELEKRNKLIEEKNLNKNAKNQSTNSPDLTNPTNLIGPNAPSDLENPATNFNPQTDDNDALILINSNLRNNIKLSLSIYKKLNNFEHYYIHELFDKKTESTT